MKKLLIVVLVLAVAAGTLMAGGGREASAADKNTVVVAMSAGPANLDPAATNDQPSSRVMKQIYDTLLNLDDNMAPVPSLAERWNWDSPTSLRLFLKRNVRFHNNEVFTARDVKFTLDRAAQSAHIGHITSMIQNVQVVNDYEVVINLPYPFAPLLNHLAHTATSIVNERAVTAGGANYGQNPVGTGPMRFVRYTTGVSVELTRWDSYYGTAPRIQNINFRIISDPATRLLELETGGVDIYYDVLPSDVPRVAAHPDLQVVRGPNLSTNYVGFNCQKAPFNDVRVRQAVLHALDLDAIVRTVYVGLGSPGTGPINSKVWASAADRLPRYQYSQARARQLLTEAGFPNGFTTTLATNDSQTRIDTAEIVQNMLGQVGIRVNVQIMEWGAYLDHTANGDHDMYILGWVTVTGDPDYGLHATFHSSNFGAAGNRSFYSNPEVDRILDAARRETNLQTRQQLYYDAQVIIHREAPWIFKWFGEDAHGVRSNVRGFQIHPAGHHHVWPVYFE